MSAITVIVAMEPKTLAHEVFLVELSVIKEQVDTVIKGIGIDALKTGMLPTMEIIECFKRCQKTDCHWSSNSLQSE